MTPAEWHAAAMELAERCETLQVMIGDAPGGDSVLLISNMHLEARAALSAHLLAYPVGEPIAHCSLTASGKIEHFDGNPMVMVGPVGNYLHPVPLYRNPKESA